MRVIEIDRTTPDKLLASSISEPDASQGEIEWTAGTYNEGDIRVISALHRKYQAVVTTTDSPSIGVSKIPPTWVDIGSTNKFAMFGDVIAEPSIDENLTVTIRHDAILDSMNGFGISGAGSVNILCVSDSAGTVLDETIELRKLNDIDDYWDWFFLPIQESDSFSLDAIPAFSDMDITVTFAGDNCKVGLLKVGNSSIIGVTEFDSSLQLVDYSRAPESEFGIAPDQIVKRRTAKLGRFKLVIPTDNAGDVFNQISTFTGKPCIWIGSEKYSNATSIYGIYRDFNVTLSYPTISNATLEVLGLT